MWRVQQRMMTNYNVSWQDHHHGVMMMLSFLLLLLLLVAKYSGSAPQVDFPQNVKHGESGGEWNSGRVES